MHRRCFLRTLGVSLLAAPLAAEAQQARVRRVGILSTGNPRSTTIFQAFEQRLHELGYVEGQNLVIEFRDAGGRVDRLPGLAAELVRSNMDVVVVATDPATRAIKAASAKVSIVMVGVNYDPVALGYIASLARPGTNVTGVFLLHRELTSKRIGLFKEMLPAVKRVAVLSDPLAAEQLKEVNAANRSMGLKLQPLELQNPPHDFNNMFRAAKRSGGEAIFVLEAPSIFRARTQIAEAALKNRLPTSFAFREYVEAGGLTSYGVNFLDMWRRAAEYTDKILKGTEPADLPVEQPTKFELVLNLKTAKTLGLTIPHSLLLQADHVIG